MGKNTDVWLCETFLCLAFNRSVDERCFAQKLTNVRVISEIQRFIDESIGNAFDFVQFSLKSKYTKRSNDTLRKCDDKDFIFKNEIIASLSMRKNADRNSTR